MARTNPELDAEPLHSADEDSRHLNRRSYLQLAGAAAATVGVSTGVSTAAVTDDMEVIDLEYDAYDSPAELYAVNDNRSGIPPTFVSEPTNGTSTALRTEFSGNQKTANVEYRFTENGYEMPSEVYTRFDVYPEGIRLGANDTVRLFWLPLTNGTGSSGGGGPNGTNGWSNAIGFANRNNSPAPEGYNFFSYSYHMDGSGDFEMTSAPVWMDQWNEIEGYIRCNTFSGGQANRDGVMRYWLNGDLVYERTNFRMTTSDSNLIEGVGPLGYVVGSNLSGSALLYDNHQIAIGGIPDDRDESPPYEDDPTLVEPSEQSDYDERLSHRAGSDEASYRLYVEGDIVQSDWSQATYNETVEITAEEYAIVEATTPVDSVDGYFFNGEIVAIDADPSRSTIWLSGEQIDPEDYPDSPADDTEAEEPLENGILIDGVGTTEPTRYTFTVSGTVEKSTDAGASINDTDVIENGSVTGQTAGWRDAFRFSGELEELTVDGPARVLVNGETVDPADYGAEYPQTLTVVGNGSEAVYEATVDGTITIDEDTTGESVERRSDESVSGEITRGVHRFRFAGELVDFEFETGETQVYLGSDRIDPATYTAETRVLPHAIVIDNSESAEPTSYSFAIDGAVVQSSYRDATIDPEDAVEGQSVTATAAAGELDAYWFDGDITDFSMNGTATVDVTRDIQES